ncbi:hypothetical protein [Marinobacter sp.]|uniref:hypothetical protein n=1 Tax=Marinobacter sp. TaxID=50741 RepID=UPI003BACE853
MRALSVDQIFDKGMHDEASLSEDEWPIFAVAYLESVADMQGWDHFFTYNMEWCPLVTRILKLSGDLQSLRVIEDYRKHFEHLGVGFEADEIDQFLAGVSHAYLDECPDWREEFTQLANTRWELIAQYCRNVGVNLQT